ncbi:MAG TPA: hypothetical protein VEU62_18130, partial [Bryobacterales bacterium]|nr:hypothetical protein [Bryobacterales bacterium]
MAALFQAIANNHSVPREQVQESVGHRRASLDLAVILSFAVLYGFAASVMARRVWRRFPVDEGWMAGAVAVLVISLVFSAGGVLAGEQWSVAMENFRL